MIDKVDIPNTKLYRDIHSKAILNVDKEKRDKYYLQRELALREKVKYDDINSRISKLESDISDIKNLLVNLSEKIR
jgi:BMFP domain-containing protein YqiC